MAAIVKVFQICCPWFFPSSSITEYHKRISETEQEQFMKQTIQPHHQHHARTHAPSHAHHHLHDHARTHAFHQPKHKSHHQHHKQDNGSFNDNSLQTTKSSDIFPSQSFQADAKLNYTDCINSSHPYYSLIISKLQQLPGIFNLHVSPQSKIADNDYNLKIFIKQADNDKINIFVYSYTFPTTFQFYDEMQNNFDLQKTFDSNVDSYLCKQKLDDNTKIVYLAYKKILIVSPRDFVFVRYSFKKNNQNWTISASIQDAETNQGKTRGTIVLTATRAIQKQGRLQITVYSQVDMKMPVKASAAKVRGVTEIKKYLDKCYQHVLKQKNNII